ncbi:unnamed protein product [Effrenium voratum]|nr:unnamed protein product [Effrenium voratum]
MRWILSASLLWTCASVRSVQVRTLEAREEEPCGRRSHEEIAQGFSKVLKMLRAGYLKKQKKARALQEAANGTDTTEHLLTEQQEAEEKATAQQALSQQAERYAAEVQAVICDATLQILEMQAKIDDKLWWLRSALYGKTALQLPFTMKGDSSTNQWVDVLLRGSTTQRKAAKALRYIHLSQIHVLRVRKLVQTVLLAEARSKGVDIVTDDLFEVLSPAYGFFHEALKAKLEGGLCHVLDSSEDFSGQYQEFISQAWPEPGSGAPVGKIMQAADFLPSVLDTAGNLSAWEVVAGKPPPAKCIKDAESRSCRNVEQASCLYCLGSMETNGAYWSQMGMMVATVTNALADVTKMGKATQDQECITYFGKLTA